MSGYTVYLTDGRTAEVTANSITVDASGALVFASGSPAVILAANTWTAAYREGVQILWKPTESPAPAGARTPTPRFGIIPRQRATDRRAAVDARISELDQEG